nr:Uncharacterised protein [Ipomoea batatas]GMC51320.1 Uncharacterised protein [Ipomoea batatas]GMC78452.1 Uncharacterised protein [Ipomoea batatas]
MPANLSNTSPPLIRSPCFAPSEVPTRIAVGVARPKAQGQDTTWTSTASFKLRSRGSPSGPEISFSKTSGKILEPR